ncbi:cysteine protease StiP family protein [Faucicola mancuniensis]|uniref:cysteine protease StiP family protein n=1 Tax=Faucicola mancuniensis TaxID=1309795 RepID=UPI0039773342
MKQYDFSTLTSGSYLASDVKFLLTILEKNAVENTDVAQKEQLIQTGKRHYSDMLTLEDKPSDTHENLFLQALDQYQNRMASDIFSLAYTLKTHFVQQVSHDKPLILLSLVRAGLPVGVLLQRIFADTQFNCQLPSQHFGMSIIRERSLDSVALAWVLTNFPDSPIVFVDGWTGKGAIYHELKNSLEKFNKQNPQFDFKQQIYHQNDNLTHEPIIPLVTLSDPAGVAWLSASDDDWLMPASLLNSTVSGLISRTLFAKNADEFHACVYYDNLEKFDKSLFFIDNILNCLSDMQQKNHILPKILTYQSTPTFRTKPVISRLANKFHIDNLNRIKPTIAEATRAVLRREPERVLLQNADHADTVLLRHLCAQRNVAIEIVGDKITPYQAITIIKKRQ